MTYKNPSRKHAPRLSTPVRLGVAAVASCFISAPALSNPVNPVVVNGAATFNQAGNVLTVTNSNGAIINWDKFSIKAGETTHFAQTAASSTVLNRVLNDPTAIYGTLSSNGRVWLVNPAGILVGPGGRVDTAGFVASTLNIRNEDFLAGRHLFINDGMAKDVINQGEIRTPAGGSVYLIGTNVSNEGFIFTPQGETILAAGQTVSLIDSATPGVKVDITGATGNATNLGEITAEAGRIGIAGVIVRNSGTLNASSVVNEGGRIFLKASQDAYVDGNGRIVTTGTKGGRVEVLGNRVAVMDQASIDASGETGGGRIMVGGDYQGKNPDIQNASITYFGPDATLKVNATKVGAGGTAIVWADDTARAFGTITARGGSESGDGGFVEVSGKGVLDFRASVDTRATNGAVGTLLLDPTNIYIATDITAANSAGMGGIDTTVDGTGPDLTPVGTVTDSLLTTASLATALASSSVNVHTNNATGTGGGNITVVSPISWGTANTLKLLAENNVAVNANITGSGSLYLVSGWDTLSGAVNPSATSGSGSITVANAVTAAASSLYARAAGTITTTGSGKMTGYLYLKSVGNILVTVDGDITAQTTGNGSSISISDPGAIVTQSLGITTNNGNITLTPTGAPSSTLNGPTNAGTGALTLSGSGTYTVPVASAVTAGSYTLSAATLTLIGSGEFDSFTQTGGVLNGTGSLQVNNSFTNSGGTFPTTLNNLSINQAAGTFVPGNLTSVGTLYLSAPILDLTSSVLTGATVGLKTDSLINAGANSVVASSAISLQPKSTSTNMQIGGTQGSGLYLPASLAPLSPGTTLQLGSDDPLYTGTTTVSALVTVPAGKNLSIRGGVPGGAGGSLYVSAPIEWSGSETVKLQSGGYLNINGTGRLTNTTGNGTLTMYGGSSIWNSSNATNLIKVGSLEVVVNATGMQGISLSGMNEVGTVAMGVTNSGGGGGIAFESNRPGGLTIGTVGVTSGLTVSNDQTIQVIGYYGGININQNISAPGAGSSNAVAISSDGANSGSVVLAANTTITSGAVDIHTTGAGAVTIGGTVYGSSVAIGSTSGDILINGSLQKSGSTNGTVGLTAGRNILIGPGATIGLKSGATGTVDVTLNSDSDQVTVPGGAIFMDVGSSIISNGGNIVLGGCTDPLTYPATGYGANVSGIKLNSATLNAGAGNISLRGTGLAATAAAIGIESVGSTLLTSSGTITLVGTNPNGGAIDLAGLTVQGGSLTAYGDVSLDPTSTVRTGTGISVFGNLTSAGILEIGYGGTISAISTTAYGSSLGSFTSTGTLKLRGGANQISTATAAYGATVGGTLDIIGGPPVANSYTIVTGTSQGVSGSFAAITQDGAAPSPAYTFASGLLTIAQAQQCATGWYCWSPTNGSDWTTLDNWQYGGSAVTAYPNSSSTSILIGSGSTVTLPSATTIYGGSVTLGGTLSLLGTLWTNNLLLTGGQISGDNTGLLKVTNSLAMDAASAISLVNTIDITHASGVLTLGSVSAGSGGLTVNAPSIKLTTGVLSNSSVSLTASTGDILFYGGSSAINSAGLTTLSAPTINSGSAGKIWADTQGRGVAVTANALSLTAGRGVSGYGSTSLGINAASITTNNLATTTGANISLSSSYGGVLTIDGVTSAGPSWTSIFSSAGMSIPAGAAITVPAGSLTLFDGGSSLAIDKLINVSGDLDLWGNQVSISQPLTANSFNLSAGALSFTGTGALTAANSSPGAMFDILVQQRGGSPNIAVYGGGAYGGATVFDPANIAKFNANNIRIWAVNPGASVTVVDPISASGKNLTLAGSALIVNNTVYAGKVNYVSDTFTASGTTTATTQVSIAPMTAAYGMQISASSTLPSSIWLEAATLNSKFVTPDLTLSGGTTTSNIQIDTALTQSGSGFNSLALLTAGTVTQGISGGITLPAGGTLGVKGSSIVLNVASVGNGVDNLVAETTSGGLSFTNNRSLSLAASYPSYTPANSGVTAAGALSLVTTAGNITAASGASARGITSISLTAYGDIGAIGAPLNVVTPILTTNAQYGSLWIGGHSSGTPLVITTTALVPYGSVTFDNYGGTTIGTSGISAYGGINVTAHSPLTVSGPITSTGGGNIVLTAGMAQSSTSTDLVTVDNSVTSYGGTITLAGYSVGGTSVPTGATKSIYTPPPPPPPPPPSLATCTTAPTTAGCTAVLPPLATCTTTPTAAGCSAVLPPLATCTTAPTTAGCTAVLPPLATCTTDPTAAGCTAVLPPLATCTTAPTTAGCTAVLPPLATCTTTPAAAGCSAVLPPLATCTTTPTAAGCSAVLPPLATCTTAPTTAGCTAVLPPLATCTTDPTAAGCSAVLPPLTTCTTAPTTAGCTAVLPPLATCTTTPTAAGCSAVLPPLTTCTTAPTTAGCTAVLPPLATCTTTPTAAGCSAVLPPLATCTTAPTTAGCSAVLPPLATCTTDPTAAGCAAVLPSVSACTSAPTAAGCSTVLPPLATCVTTPTAAGCSAVLPSVSTCTTDPTATGCSAVLPTLTTCITDPAAAGCSAVLPKVALVVTTSTTTSQNLDTAVNSATSNPSSNNTASPPPPPQPPAPTGTNTNTPRPLPVGQTLGGTSGTFGAESAPTSLPSGGTTTSATSEDRQATPSGSTRSLTQSSSSDKPASETKKDEGNGTKTASEGKDDKKEEKEDKDKKKSDEVKDRKDDDKGKPKPKPEKC